MSREAGIIEDVQTLIQIALLVRAPTRQASIKRCIKLGGAKLKQRVDKSAICHSAMTRDQALAAANDLVPKLSERSNACAAARSCPIETIEDLKTTGLMSLLQPARFGGSQLGWDVFCEALTILAEGCGSQAWVYRVLGDHQQMIGLFPEQAQQDVWGDNPSALASSSFAPLGLATPVPGGYQFSGKHSFSSGIDHAEWVICGGRIVTDDVSAKQVAAYFLVPKAEGLVVDDWQVNGLEGTGSKSFHVEDVIVPSHRVLDWEAAEKGSALGGARTDAAPLFRLPRGGFTTTAFSALLVGMARGMMSEWLDVLAKRRMDGTFLARSQVLQLTAGQAAMELEAAQQLYLPYMVDIMHRLSDGELLPVTEAGAARARAAFACQLVLTAVGRLHESTGSSAIYAGRPMERQFRNILAGAQHVGVNWPRAGAAIGAQALTAHGADLG